MIREGSSPAPDGRDVMIATHAPNHLVTALARFRRFFEELQATFVERDNVLTQIGLALLGRQHVLMTGPPGTAKSQLASLVLGRIIDESTGAPSLFSRQFTESTVQTDLVGPIDFKTLMDTGRTEHFTDEGMLGSVHAFLDEVLDGRDMLLRSTLNILHERELKQGSITTKGRIECAFMTSNRYIAEVLDGARETLLAFIDRISYISFIPRGFASPESLRSVVRRHGGGFGQHTPSAYLSVQDLDVLQAATDLVYVPEAICDAVTDLVAMLDMELAEAQRSDPKFQPTRYLSTRTAVQATRVLRAIAVLDKIFGHPDRALQVEHDDLGSLRYFLLLNGVPREALAACIDRETDPRERRQLDIMATEAEIFERCFAKLPRVAPSVSPRRLELGALEAMTTRARASGDPEALTQAVQSLVTATESGATDASTAARMLVDTMGALSEQALRAGLLPRLEGEDVLKPLAEQLTELSGNLERATGRGRPLAQWLRGRFLQLLDDALRLSPATTSATLELLASSPNGDAIARQIESRFASSETVFALRRQLLASGAVATAAEGEQADPWPTALDDLEEELTLLWDAWIRVAAVELLGRSAATPLHEVLRELTPVVTSLQTDARRFEALGRPSKLLRRVIGARLEPVVARAFERLDGRNRNAVIEQVEAVAAELRRAGLGGVITAERFVAWTASVLVRDEPTPAAGPAVITLRREYDEVRAREAAISITDTLVGVALATLPSDAISPMAPSAAAEAVREVLRELDDDPRERVVSLDLARIVRRIEALELWWRCLTVATEAEPDDAEAAVALLEAVVRSGWLRSMRGDAEPLRLVTELGHLVEVFPDCGPRAGELRRRLEALDASSTRTLVTQLEDQADRAWSVALAGGRGPTRS
jgi:MoxR-like ATPase